MGFSRSHNDELKSLERGRAGADTPMSNQDFDASMSIQDNALPRSIRDDESPVGGLKSIGLNVV